MTLYDDLNIKENATPDEIKKAYRQKAKENHPDVSKQYNKEAADDFNKSAHAYKILSNEKTRLQYDETGEESGDSEKSIRSKAIDSLCQSMSNIISQFSFGNKLLYEDIISQLMTNSLRGIEKTERVLKELKDKKKNLNSFKKRLSFKGKEEDNIFAVMINKEISGIKISVDDNKMYLEVFDEAIKILEDYKFEVKEEEQKESPYSAHVFIDQAFNNLMKKP